MRNKQAKVRVTRQNYIKKYQLKPEQFTIQQGYAWGQLQFCDKYLFRPKSTMESPQVKPVSTSFNKPTHIKSIQKQAMTIQMPQKKVYEKNQQKHRGELNFDSINDKKSKTKHRQRFLKKGSVDLGSLSCKQQKSPKYPLLIMKPCNFSPIKIKPRPVTASAKPKRQSSKNTKIIRQRSLSLKNHSEISVLELSPWETDQIEL